MPDDETDLDVHAAKEAYNVYVGYIRRFAGALGGFCGSAGDRTAEMSMYISERDFVQRYQSWTLEERAEIANLASRNETEEIREFLRRLDFGESGPVL